jgi:hypothetical protein
MLPKYQPPLDFLKETAIRFKGRVPGYWRRLQVLAGSVAVLAGVLIKFEHSLSQAVVPYIHHALTGGLLIAGTSQLACKDKDLAAPSPTAALEAKLTSILPDTPPPDGPANS